MNVIMQFFIMCSNSIFQDSAKTTKMENLKRIKRSQSFSNWTVVAIEIVLQENDVYSHTENMLKNFSVHKNSLASRRNRFQFCSRWLC